MTIENLLGIFPWDYLSISIDIPKVSAFLCDVIAAMLEGKNNTFSLLWQILFPIFKVFFSCKTVSLFQPSNMAVTFSQLILSCNYLMKFLFLTLVKLFTKYSSKIFSSMNH